MGPIQSITTCLRKSFDFSGRATRAEFWWFFGTWFVFIVAAFALVGWAYQFLPGHLPTIFAWKTMKVIVFVGCFLPLSTIARRHHDLSTPAVLPFLAGLTLFVLLYTAFAFVPLSLGIEPPFIMAALDRQLDFLLLFIGLIALSAVIAIWPSSPGPNRYGPNPREVTP